MKNNFVFVLGAKLAVFIANSGVKQGDFADAVGVSRQTVNGWLSKERIKMTIDVASKAAEALGIGIDVLTDVNPPERGYTEFKRQIFEGDYIGMHRRAWEQFEENMNSNRELLRQAMETIRALAELRSHKQVE